jgi:hypothetical protein
MGVENHSLSFYLVIGFLNLDIMDSLDQLGTIQDSV